MTHSVRRHLRIERIEAYDREIRRFIPGYDAMLATVARAVAARRPALAVDLGAGTGALAEAILRSGGTESVELVDIDAEMLRQARLRLKRFGAQARFRERSFFDPLPRCHAVAASLALHHVPNIEDKQALYRHVHDALWPGGVFLNADVVMPKSRDEQEAVYRLWAAHLTSSGIPETRAYEHFAEWAGEDTYFPLDKELGALAAAGFEVATIWSQSPLVVLKGVRRGLSSPTARDPGAGQEGRPAT